MMDGWRVREGKNREERNRNISSESGGGGGGGGRLRREGEKAGVVGRGWLRRREMVREKKRETKEKKERKNSHKHKKQQYRQQENDEDEEKEKKEKGKIGKDRRAGGKAGHTWQKGDTERKRKRTKRGPRTQRKIGERMRSGREEEERGTKWLKRKRKIMGSV